MGSVISLLAAAEHVEMECECGTKEARTRKQHGVVQDMIYYVFIGQKMQMRVRKTILWERRACKQQEFMQNS